MKKTLINAVVIFLILIASVCVAETLCKNSEKVIFSCSLKNGKIVSVCSSMKLTKDEGYLQYRFGTSAKTELVYPSTTKSTQEKFYWRYMRGSDGAGGDLSFKNHEFLYTVGRADAYEETNDKSGSVNGTLTITKIVGPRVQYNLKCSEGPEGDFYTLLDNVVKDEEELIDSK